MLNRRELLAAAVACASGGDPAPRLDGMRIGAVRPLAPDVAGAFQVFELAARRAKEAMQRLASVTGPGNCGEPGCICHDIRRQILEGENR